MIKVRYKYILICIILILFSCIGCNKNSLSRKRTMVFAHCDIENHSTYEDLAKEYSDNNKGLNIEVKFINKEEYDLSLFKGKSAPDVFVITEDMDFEKLIDDKKVLNLKKFIDENNLGENDILLREGQDVWSVPVTYNIPLIFYNKELFTKNQLTIPENISDFIRLCSVLELYEIYSFGIACDDKGRWDIKGMSESVFANSVDGGDFLFDKEKVNSGFPDLIGLSNEIRGKFPQKQEMQQSSSNLIEDFLNGKYAMVFGATNDIRFLEDNDEFEYGFFIMPGALGKENITLNYGMSLGINKKSKLAGDGEKFISYLKSQEIQEKLSSKFYEIPSIKGVQIKNEELKKVYEYTGNSSLVLSIFQDMSLESKNICLDTIDSIFSDEMGDSDKLTEELTFRLNATLSNSNTKGDE